MASTKFLDPEIIRRYRRYYTYIEPVVRDPMIRGYFSLVASLLLVAFLIFFALSPTIDTIITLQRKIDDQKKVVAALDQKITDLAAASDNYHRLENSLPLLDSALPEKPAPETILAGVTTAASSSGIALSTLQFKNIPLSPDAKVEADVSQKSDQLKPLLLGLPTVNFVLTTTTSPNAIPTLLSKLELLPRLIRVGALSLTKNLTTPDYTLEVSGLGYYFPNNSQDKP